MRRPDLLLTHGYFLRQDPGETRPYPPLGLLYLTSHLRARGFDVAVFDTTFSDPGTLRRLLERTRPPVVGIYGNLMTRRNVLRIARIAREVGARVVLGGPEPSSYAREYLERGADVVVAGEGELTLEELLPRLGSDGPSRLEDVSGIFYRREAEVIETAPRAALADLDTQPFPARDAIDLEPYLELWRRHHGGGSVSLITARGCPYKCRWCSHSVFGFSHRRRSAANVADEVEEIAARYRPDLLWYADDVFTIHHAWLFEYADELARRGLRIPFEAISREDRLDEEVVRRLAEMGCFRLWVGAESGSQRVLDAMERQTDAIRMREMVALLQRHGIEVGTFIMLGYDGETPADIEATVDHLKAALPDRVLTTVAYPIKGTAFYADVEDRLVAPSRWEEASDRDLGIAGRRSRRFYRFAIRWMVNEVAWTRGRRDRSGGTLAMAKAYLNARLGRLGMLATSHEVEPEAG